MCPMLEERSAQPSADWHFPKFHHLISFLLLGFCLLSGQVVKETTEPLVRLELTSTCLWGSCTPVFTQDICFSCSWTGNNSAWSYLPMVLYLFYYKFERCKRFRISFNYPGGWATFISILQLFNVS